MLSVKYIEDTDINLFVQARWDKLFGLEQDYFISECQFDNNDYSSSSRR